MACTRHLYLARHAQPGESEQNLTSQGIRQAVLLGERLSPVSFDVLAHGPLPRAEQTAAVVARYLSPAVEVRAVDEAGDYILHMPAAEEIEAAHARFVQATLENVNDSEATEGKRLGKSAIAHFTGPVDSTTDRHELVITHAFTIGWLVRHALDSPAWRWWGLNFCHASLTVIRYFPDRPPTLVVVNDVSHLPAELRWTDFPAHADNSRC